MQIYPHKDDLLGSNRTKETLKTLIIRNPEASTEKGRNQQKEKIGEIKNCRGD